MSKSKTSKKPSIENSTSITSDLSNNGDVDISVVLHEFIPHDPIRRGTLKLTFSGADANDELINSLGRILINRVPTYAFPSELIKIERINPESGFRDSVAFNHDYMRLHLSQFPVMGMDAGVSYLHEKYWKDVDYLDEKREKHENEKRIEINVDKKNTTDDIIHVTSNDMRVYVDNELKNIYNKDYPFLIISLKPKEGIVFSMKAVLGVGMRHTIWDGASNYCHDQETIPGKTIFIVQSGSRMDEFTLFQRGLDYYKIRTKLLRDEMERLYLLEKDISDRFIIRMKGEDHTMGAPINYEIQSHPDILKSGVVLPDFSAKNIVIDLTAFDKNKILNAMKESFDRLYAKIEKIESEFKKIKKPDVLNNYQPQYLLKKKVEELKEDSDSDVEDEPKSKSKSKSKHDSKSKSKKSKK